MKICPKCKAKNKCAIANDKSAWACWCMNVVVDTNELTKDPDDGCYCKACATGNQLSVAQQTVNDRRYHYNMNFFDFMSIYQSYRSGIETEVKEEEIIKEDIDTNGILTQSEIDALFDKV